MNTLAHIGDNYWVVRDDWAEVRGVVVRHTDIYIAHYDNEPPTALVNIDAVLDYVGSDPEHYIDTRDIADVCETMESDVR